MKFKYESEFRIKEKEFYPREKYSHKKVIDELANIVKRADLEIDELHEDIKSLSTSYDAGVFFKNERVRTFVKFMISSVLLNVVLIIANFL